MNGDDYVQALAKWIQKEGKRLAQRYPDPPIAISLHHLYYLLTRFDDLEVPIGPLNIRLEDINGDGSASKSSSTSNYVSFSKRNSDAASIRSVSSIRSVMSTVTSSMWNGFGVFGSSIKTEEQIVEELKILYSAFCKIPTIRICPTSAVKSISGFEEYPFDTAVPLLAFKNLQFLEVFNYSPKQFYGWDELSEQIRSLVVKRAGLTDVALLTIGVIREEQEKKRRKAERATRYWQNVSDGATFVPGSPRPGTAPSNTTMRTQIHDPERPRSASPSHSLSRPGVQTRRSSRNDRRHTSANSLNTGIPSLFVLSPRKWQFLRYLSLSDNGLEEVSEEALAPLASHLYFLDLSKNKFKTVPAALSTLSALRSLDMSRNAIESLHSLAQSPLPGISTLNLCGNVLNTIAGIERLPSLERVDLRDNLLRDPTEVARLNSAPNIAEIWVSGNSFTRALSDYRITIFNIFRENTSAIEDITLDGKKPGLIEKRSLNARAVESLPSPRSTPTSAMTTPSKAETSVINAESVDNSLKPKKKLHKSRIIDLSSGSPNSKNISDPQPV